jgi:hypothetical protein
MWVIDGRGYDIKSTGSQVGCSQGELGVGRIYRALGEKALYKQTQETRSSTKIGLEPP